MKTTTLHLKTMMVAMMLIFFSDIEPPKTIIKQEKLPSTTWQEPLQLSLLKIKHELQRGQIILLQNSIENQLNN